MARVLSPGGLAYISEPVYAGEFNDIPGSLHGRIPRKLGKWGFEAGHLPAFLVDGNQQRRQTASEGTRLAVTTQLLNLLWCFQVA